MRHGAKVPRLVFRPVRTPLLPDVAWWPENRVLEEQLPQLVERWPAHAGRIVQARYSAPDWDDDPAWVMVNGWRVRTSSFAENRLHLLILSLLDHQWRSILVIPPDARPDVARRVLNGLGGPDGDSVL